MAKRSIWDDTQQEHKEPETATVGDDSLSRIYGQYSSFVRYVAWMNAPDDSLVDDIVQESFLALLRFRERLDLDKDPRSLLRTITRNIAVDHWRRAKLRKPAHLMELSEILQNETARIETEMTINQTEEEISALNICIKKLTPRSRSLIERHYFRGELLKNLALELKISLQTLYRHLDRIRISLKKCIETTLGIEVSDA